MRRDLEIQVAQNLRAEPVAKANIFEPDHSQLRPMDSGDLYAVNCLCGRYGFRFVNGRVVAWLTCHRLSAPCISFVRIVRQLTPSIPRRLAMADGPSAAPAAKRCGSRGPKIYAP